MSMCFGLLLVSCVFFLCSCAVSRIGLAAVVSACKAQRIRNYYYYYYYYYYHHRHHHHHHPNLRHIIWARCSSVLLTQSFNLSPSDISNVLTGNHSVPSEAGVLFLVQNIKYITNPRISYFCFGNSMPRIAFHHCH